MARRVVTHTLKNSEGDILFLCHPYEKWSPRSMEEVIADIADEEHTYVVEQPNQPDTAIHVVDDPSRSYLRTDHDTTTQNNLDSLPSCLPRFLGNYPDDEELDWSNKLQGVTHSSDHWFFTQEKKLHKFHVSTDLKTGSPVLDPVHMPSELSSLGCNHFGDPDYLEVDRQGYIFVPVEGNDDCEDEPRLAVFRDDADLTYIGASLLAQQNDQLSTPRAGWCAFSPVDGCLYSSYNVISGDHPVFRYRLDAAALGQGQVVLEPEGDLPLQHAGTAVEIPQFIQGGCFSPNGILFLCTGKMNGQQHLGGIRAFSPSGQLLYHSAVSRKPFQYEYHDLEEPEGITFWDLDRLPTGTQAPNIQGQLHAILLNKDALEDNLYFKHYRIGS